MDLVKILEEHKEWIDSNGEGGKRADLRWSDLRGAIVSPQDIRRSGNG